MNRFNFVGATYSGHGMKSKNSIEEMIKVSAITKNQLVALIKIRYQRTFKIETH